MPKEETDAEIIADIEKVKCSLEATAENEYTKEEEKLMEFFLCNSFRRHGYKKGIVMPDNDKILAIRDYMEAIKPIMELRKRREMNRIDSVQIPIPNDFINMSDSEIEKEALNCMFNSSQ